MVKVLPLCFSVAPPTSSSGDFGRLGEEKKRANEVKNMHTSCLLSGLPQSGAEEKKKNVKVSGVSQIALDKF